MTYLDNSWTESNHCVEEDDIFDLPILMYVTYIPRALLYLFF